MIGSEHYILYAEQFTPQSNCDAFIKKHAENHQPEPSEAVDYVEYVPYSIVIIENPRNKLHDPYSSHY